MKIVNMKLFYVQFLLVFISNGVKGKETIKNSKIAHAHDARIWNFPYMAALEHQDGSLECALSIIHELWLAGTAHCIRGWDVVQQGRVRTGSSFINKGGDIYYIKQVYPHPDFNATSGINNFGLTKHHGMKIINMELFYVFLCLAFIITGIKGKEGLKDQKIAAGYPARIWNFPFVAALERKDGAFECALSIIHEFWLAGTAHCLKGWDAVKDGRVRAGSSYLDEGGYVYDIKKIFPHPDHNVTTGLNNFGLTQTNRSMGPLDRVHNKMKIAIVSSRFILQDGMWIVYAGWGMVNEERVASRQLQAARALVVADRICNEAYTILGWKHWRITATDFCVSSIENAGCRGDGGAPAIFDKTLVGFLSASWSSKRKCKPTINPSIFTKVSTMFDYVVKTTKLRF